MPKYEYLCEVNGQIVEVSHSMNEHLSNWGELCSRANLEPGEIPQDSKIRRIISGGIFTTRKKSEPSSHDSSSFGGCSCCPP